MQIIISLLKFGVVLGILIFVHELGHFLVARRVGVYVKKFFLGFDIKGWKIFSWKGKETEYGIGILPLGGYVKMVGQEDLPESEEKAKEKEKEDEDADIPPERRFDRKPLHQRAAIVLAGPLMNLLLGLFLFILIAFLGIRVPKNMSQAVVGQVEKNLPAAGAGLLPGDEIVSVGKKQISDWSDLLWEIQMAPPGKPLAVQYRRGDQLHLVHLTPKKFLGSPYPRIGIARWGEAAVWSVQTESPAFTAGLRRGTIISAIDGKPAIYTQAERIINASPDREITLTVISPGQAKPVPVKLKTISRSFIPGLYLKGNRVLAVDYHAASEVRKLKKGDRIVTAEGKEVQPAQLQEIIRDSQAGKIIALGISRSGWMFFRSPTHFTVKAQIDSRGTIPGLSLGYSSLTVLIKYRGWQAVRKGTEMTVETVKRMVQVVYFLIVGRVETSELAGPIGIFTITSTVEKFSQLLTLLAIISLNLGIINLLPIPVLDGGHLLFISLEGIFRRPLSPRLISIAQQTGIFILLALFVLVTYNDIIHRLLGY